MTAKKLVRHSLALVLTAGFERSKQMTNGDLATCKLILELLEDGRMQEEDENENDAPGITHVQPDRLWAGFMLREVAVDDHTSTVERPGPFRLKSVEPRIYVVHDDIHRRREHFYYLLLYCTTTL